LGHIQGTFEALSENYLNCNYKIWPYESYFFQTSQLHSRGTPRKSSRILHQEASSCVHKESNI
jgi:hypothetical protein